LQGSGDEAHQAWDLDRRESRSRLLLEVNNAIVSFLSLPELLAALSACLRGVIAHDLAGLVIWDSEKNELLAYALNFAEGQDYVGVLFTSTGQLLGSHLRPVGQSGSTTSIVLSSRGI
jgi:hypothetical protein